MQHDEYRGDPNVESIPDMQSCCALTTLLSKIILALVVGVIYLVVRLLQ